MLLTSILCVPFVVGLLCLFARPRRLVEVLNILGFVTVLVLGVKLFKTVVAPHGTAVTEWGEFLRADALSAWMVLLLSLVSRATARDAGPDGRRERAEASGTERRVREGEGLTPGGATGRGRVVRAN